jgi:DoxX
MLSDAEEINADLVGQDTLLDDVPHRLGMRIREIVRVVGAIPERVEREDERKHRRLADIRGDHGILRGLRIHLSAVSGFEQPGIRPGPPAALLAGSAEILGGFSLGTGLLTPVGTILIGAVMTTATLTAHARTESGTPKVASAPVPDGPDSVLYRAGLRTPRLPGLARLVRDWTRLPAVFLLICWRFVDTPTGIRTQRLRNELGLICLQIDEFGVRGEPLSRGG